VFSTVHRWYVSKVECFQRDGIPTFSSRHSDLWYCVNRFQQRTHRRIHTHTLISKQCTSHQHYISSMTWVRTKMRRRGKGGRRGGKRHTIDDTYLLGLNHRRHTHIHTLPIEKTYHRRLENEVGASPSMAVVGVSKTFENLVISRPPTATTAITRKAHQFACCAVTKGIFFWITNYC